MLTRREITIARVGLLSYATRLKDTNPIIYQAKLPELETILKKLWDMREDLPKNFQVWVWVDGTQGGYWNTLEDAVETEAEANAVVARYKQAKELGFDGFRSGPPGKTKITEVR